MKEAVKYKVRPVRRGQLFLLTAAGLPLMIAGWRTTLAEKELWELTSPMMLFFSDLCS